MGVVDIEFKIEGASYTHSFIILRGLIHPMLLGLDFLRKYSANIQLGDIPSLSLRHPVQKVVTIEFVKPANKVRPPPYVSILGDITIPPRSIYYAEAHLTNFDEIGGLTASKPNRLMGITAIQNEDSHFDPGFILRDAVIDAKAAKFKVELMNPSDFCLKIEDGTPWGQSLTKTAR